MDATKVPPPKPKVVRVIEPTIKPAEETKSAYRQLRVAAYNPFNIFVCAETDAKVKRCMERKAEDEHLTEKELVRKMRQIDKMRAQTRSIMTGSEWGNRQAYHLIVNTTDWDIKALTPAVAEYANRWFEK